MIKNLQILPISNEYIQYLSQFTENIESLLFFDIETTGFHRIKDSIVSITFLSFFENESLNSDHQSDKLMKIEQFFSETPEEELTLLQECLPLFENYPIYITYNGHAFDIPFISSKYQYYNIFLTLNKCMCYDLYVIAKKLLTLGSYKLKFVEKALNIERTDQISGLECVQLYQNYQLTKDVQLAHLILHHNIEDVINLVHLTKVANNNEQYFEKSKWVRYIEYDSHLIYLYDCVIKNDMIIIQLFTDLSLKKYYFRNDLVSCSNISPSIYQIEFKIAALDYNGIPLIVPCSNSSDQFKSLELNQQIILYNKEWIFENLLELVEVMLPLFIESY